jgi:hypothetical protein
MNKVKKTFDDNVGALNSLIMNQRWQDKDFYAYWSSQHYFYISHSHPLLKHAIANCNNLELKKCLEHHAKEEKGHEKWCLADLKALGRDIKGYVEAPQTKALYEEIYEGVNEFGAAAIIGYAIALEGMSAMVCPPLAEILTPLYGAKAVTFISNHAKIDQEHAKDGYDILKFLDEKEQAVVAKFIISSIEAYKAYVNNLSMNYRMAG